MTEAVRLIFDCLSCPLATGESGCRRCCRKKIFERVAAHQVTATVVLGVGLYALVFTRRRCSIAVSCRPSSRARNKLKSRCVGHRLNRCKGLRETINSVSAGSRSRVGSTKSVPSTFKTSPRQMEAVLSSAALDATSQRSTSLGSPLVTWNAVSSPSRQKRMSSLCLLMRRSRIVRSGSQPGRRGST